ncbi:uncharacterized protein MONBRDRAFT_28773 [Monosiga brevicollis MX1]|uniref:PID domain-containing protein n=1 Tax=Monosiga brevicollis TaxID=81824 RepID=A9V955_MONBE|nr:uncharacterized protein MONBRDRAFT_28773 [Monosiga brevicollis MX1]EDQ85997.1 predicted protein [Monosiga brevicollis MX1]|eukprot:XP_001749191.1 hypothetical protein [Monosiga brevicollis MX1]
MPDFIFDSQVHTFEQVRYLGFVPLASLVNPEEQGGVLSAAAKTLLIKLQKLHDRLVSESIAKKGGNADDPRLRNAASKFLTKHGHDVRRGDPVTVLAATHAVTIKPTIDVTAEPFFFQTVHMVQCTHYTDEQTTDKQDIIVVQHSGDGRAACHLFAVAPKASRDFLDTLLEAARIGRRIERQNEATEQYHASEEAQKKQQAAPGSQHRRVAPADSDDLTLAVGIGLKRRSSIKINAGLRRRNSVQKSKGKRASLSSSVGGTSAVLAEVHEEASARASMISFLTDDDNNSYGVVLYRASFLCLSSTHDQPRQESAFALQTDPVPPSAAGFGAEDDLLDDIDESLFATSDVVEEADVGDMNMDGFGFNEEEEEGGFGF